MQTSKQRTFRKFPLLFFVLVSGLSKEQNKETLTTYFTAKDNCNSLIIVCFLSLISQAGSSDMLSACREGEGKQSERINNEFVRMYIIKGGRQSHIESK